MLSQNQSTKTHRSSKAYLNPTKKPFPDSSELSSIVEENNNNNNRDGILKYKSNLRYTEYQEVSILKDILIDKEIEIALLKKRLEQLQQHTVRHPDPPAAKISSFAINQPVAKNGVHIRARRPTIETNLQEPHQKSNFYPETRAHNHNSTGQFKHVETNENTAGIQKPLKNSNHEKGYVNLVEVRKNKHNRMFSAHITMMESHLEMQDGRKYNLNQQ